MCVIHFACTQSRMIVAMYYFEILFWCASGNNRCHFVWSCHTPFVALNPSGHIHMYLMPVVSTGSGGEKEKIAENRIEKNKMLHFSYDKPVKLQFTTPMTSITLLNWRLTTHCLSRTHRLRINSTQYLSLKHMQFRHMYDIFIDIGDNDSNNTATMAILFVVRLYQCMKYDFLVHEHFCPGNIHTARHQS